MNHKIISEAPSTDISPLDLLLNDIGVPFAIGLAVGYFAKKMLHMVLFLGGAAIVLLFACDYYNIIKIPTETLEHVVKYMLDQGKIAGSELLARLAHFTSKGVSGVAGFFVGFKL
jgi:uncharacterized membrane protein (Fun14 family)